MDRGHERKQSLVAGRQCRGCHLSRTSASTPCNRGLFPLVYPRFAPRPSDHERSSGNIQRLNVWTIVRCFWPGTLRKSPCLDVTNIQPLHKIFGCIAPDWSVSSLLNSWKKKINLKMNHSRSKSAEGKRHQIWVGYINLGALQKLKKMNHKLSKSTAGVVPNTYPKPVLKQMVEQMTSWRSVWIAKRRNQSNHTLDANRTRTTSSRSTHSLAPEENGAKKQQLVIKTQPCDGRMWHKDFCSCHVDGNGNQLPGNDTVLRVFHW